MAYAEPVVSQGIREEYLLVDAETSDLVHAPATMFAAGAPGAGRDPSGRGHRIAFSPATLQVAAGDTVVFTSRGGAPHTATANDGSFDTGRLRRGKSGEVTITGGSSIGNICLIHPNMTDRISAS